MKFMTYITLFLVVMFALFIIIPHYLYNNPMWFMWKQIKIAGICIGVSVFLTINFWWLYE